MIKRLVNLVVGRAILGRPGEDGAAVAALEVEGVGDLGDLALIAAKDRDLRPLLAGVIVVGEKVVGRGRRAALAVLGESVLADCYSSLLSSAATTSAYC